MLTSAPTPLDRRIRRVLLTCLLLTCFVGITRDRFDSHRWLQAFGLIDVEPIERNPDGTAINYAEDGASLHRLTLLPEAFRRDGLETVTAALSRRLGN